MVRMESNEPLRDDRVRQPFRMRETTRDITVLIQAREILRRGNDRHQLRPSFCGEPDRIELHAIGLARELVEVRSELRVVRQHIIGADLVAEFLERRRDLLRVRIGSGREREQDERQGPEEACRHVGPVGCGMSHRGSC